MFWYFFFTFSWHILKFLGHILIMSNQYLILNDTIWYEIQKVTRLCRMSSWKFYTKMLLAHCIGLLQFSILLYKWARKAQNMCNKTLQQSGWTMLQSSTLLGVPSFARFWRQEFGLFPRPAWALGSYSRDPPAGGTPQIIVFKTLRMTGCPTV